jgi:predicted site-specific integrase-resolvase
MRNRVGGRKVAVNVVSGVIKVRRSSRAELAEREIELKKLGSGKRKGGFFLYARVSGQPDRNGAQGQNDTHDCLILLLIVEQFSPSGIAL